MVRTLILIYFGGHQLGHIIKTNCIIFHTVDPEICSIFLEKELKIASPPHFMYYFSGKTFLVFILLTDQISLSDLCFMRYWGIGLL